MPRDIVHHAVEIFREDWERLHETPDGVRIYDFYGDDIPRILFYGALHSTNIYDFAIIEEVVQIFDADVIHPEPKLSLNTQALKILNRPSRTNRPTSASL